MKPITILGVVLILGGMRPVLQPCQLDRDQAGAEGRADPDQSPGRSHRLDSHRRRHVSVLAGLGLVMVSAAPESGRVAQPAWPMLLVLQLLQRLQVGLDGAGGARSAAR